MDCSPAFMQDQYWSCMNVWCTIQPPNSVVFPCGGERYKKLNNSSSRLALTHARLRAYFGTLCLYSFFVCFFFFLYLSFSLFFFCLFKTYNIGPLSPLSFFSSPCLSKERKKFLEGRKRERAKNL